MRYTATLLLMLYFSDISNFRNCLLKLQIEGFNQYFCSIVMNIKAKLIRDPDVTMATQSTPQFTNKAFELQQVSTEFEYSQLKKLKINNGNGT